MLPLLALLTLLWISGHHSVHGVDISVQSAVPGSSITLRCHYSAELYSMAKKVWCRQTALKGCQPLASTSDGSMTIQDRTRIRDDPSSSTVTVTMDGLVHQDSGRYHCMMIVSASAHVVRTIELVVQEGPTWVLVGKGSSTSMQCPFSASDYRVVPRTWCRLQSRVGCQPLRGVHSFPFSGVARRHRIKDDIVREVTTLYVDRLQVEDSGTYECRLQLPGVPLVMKRFQLQVRPLEDSGADLHLDGPSINSWDTSLPTRGSPAEERNQGIRRHMIMALICAIGVALLLMASLIGTLILTRRKRKSGDSREASGHCHTGIEPATEVSWEPGRIVPCDMQDEDAADLIKYTTLRLERKPEVPEATYANVICQPWKHEEPKSPSMLAISGTVEYATVFFRPSGALVPGAQ